MHSLSLRPHDKHDVGYRVYKPGDFQHYYRTNQRTTLALSHCMLVAVIDQLLEDSKSPYCKYCFMIEELRDGMDGKNDIILS